MKRLACINIDLDGLNDYAAIHGLTVDALPVDLIAGATMQIGAASTGTGHGRLSIDVRRPTQC